MAKRKAGGLGRGLNALFDDLGISEEDLRPISVSEQQKPSETPAADAEKPEKSTVLGKSAAKSKGGKTASESEKTRSGSVRQAKQTSKNAAGKSAGKSASGKGAAGSAAARKAGSDAKQSAAPKDAGRSDNTPAASGEGVVYIDINDIKPNSSQPRKNFNEEKIDELAASIKEHGIIQPLIVRKAAKGFELVAGERRWRAARKAGLKTVPCLVRELTEEQNALFAIIENMQREDLNAIEEAQAIERLIGTFGFTHDDVSKSVGKSRSYITNSVRLLKLPEEIREMVREDRLSSGHARALITITDPAKQLEIARKAADGGLSVRETETIASGVTPTKKRRQAPEKDADILRLEDELKAVLGTRVVLNGKGKKGRIEIEYYSRDELERLIELLKSLG